jgi:hypothetical protein
MKVMDPKARLDEMQRQIERMAATLAELNKRIEKLQRSTELGEEIAPEEDKPPEPPRGKHRGIQ